jgi:hypothetical protein
MKNRPSRLRATLVAASAATAIAAVAGFSAQSSAASSPATVSAGRSLSLHTSSATPASRSHRSSSAAPVASTYTSASAPLQTTAASAAAVCVTSAMMGHCQFGPYPKITGASTDPYVDQNVWDGNAIQGWHQTLHATSPGDWYVAANMPAGNTGVVSFPNTGFTFNKPLARYSSIVSSFKVKIPSRAGTNAEASYDIWFSNTSPIDEVMIQNDYSPGRGPGCATWTATNVQFGGSDGVPSHLWDLCVGTSTAWWETATGNVPSGKVNVLAMLKWLVRHGQLSRRAELTGYSYGFEISSTGGVREQFRVNSFSTAARKR